MVDNNQLYKHYKGGVYVLLGEGRHSETEEDFVIYKQENAAQIWLRPKQMFFENVTINGVVKPRFELVEKE